MSQNKFNERSNCIRVSTIPHVESVRTIKSFNLPSKTNVTQIRKFHSFSKNPFILKHNITDEQHKSHRSQHTIHAKIHHEDALKESSKNNKVQPLTGEIEYETNVRKNKESTKTKCASVIKVLHQQSQERETNNDLIITTTDSETKLTQRGSSIKHETQQETVTQNLISNNYRNDWMDYHSQKLFAVSNHQDFKAFTNVDNEIDALPRHIHSISSSQLYQSKKIDRKQKQKNKHRRCVQYGCRCCSSWCKVISVFSILLLLIGLTALLIALLSGSKNTTTTILTSTVTMTTLTSSTATISTTTTATTSSSTTISTTTSSSTTTSITTSSTATTSITTTTTTSSTSTTSTTTSSTATTSTTTTTTTSSTSTMSTTTTRTTTSSTVTTSTTTITTASTTTTSITTTTTTSSTSTTSTTTSSTATTSTTTITTASTTTTSITTTTTTSSTSTTSTTTSSTATTSTTTTTTTSSTSTTSTTTTRTTTSSTVTTSTTTITTTSTVTTSITTTTTTSSTSITSTTTSSTATTSTTTTKATSSTATTRTTTSSTTTTSRTTTSTTTTAYSCGQSCLNQSWSNSSGVLALWSFEGSFADSTNVYNGVPSTNPPTFITGYFGQAASFNASSKQAVYTSFIPLNNVSFTIEVWIKPTAYPNSSTDFNIVGLCPIINTSTCLHILVRSQKLYFGFYSNDVSGVTLVPLNQWTHAAFVYDATKKTQTIYMNGFQENQRTGSSALLVSSANFTIATNEHVSTSTGYFQGAIDELSINQRPKSSCEILETATLAAYFKFDTSSPYNDSGPSTVDTTASSTSIVSGYLNQAIAFNGSSSSYFQTWGFTSLGISNQTFSITFWILPQTLTGTLVHLSSSSLGTGSTCFPLLGFNSNGAIIAQVLTNGVSVVTATGPVLPVSSSWVPVVQTWSSTNGLRLYVNNTLVSSVAVSTSVGSGTTPNYVTLGGCLNGCDACSNGSVGAPGPFEGAIDDWRIYSRELTAIDVCTLFKTV